MSYTDFTGDGATTEFTVGFQYDEPAFVFVTPILTSSQQYIPVSAPDLSLAATETPGIFTVLDDGSPVDVGVRFRIYRDSVGGLLLANEAFSNKSIFTSEDMNRMVRAIYYSYEELTNAAENIAGANIHAWDVNDPPLWRE